jgi:hypothetical protein
MRVGDDGDEAFASPLREGRLRVVPEGTTDPSLWPFDPRVAPSTDRLLESATGLRIMTGASSLRATSGRSISAVRVGAVMTGLISSLFTTIGPGLSLFPAPRGGAVIASLVTTARPPPNLRLSIPLTPPGAL